MRTAAKRVWNALAFSSLWLAPALARAAEEGGAHEGGGNPWVSLLLKFVNFAILAAILYKALKKTVTQGLADRSESVRKELHDAREAKAAAEAKYREYKDKVSHLEEEVRKLRDDFQAEGERQKERILKEAADAAASVARQAEAAGANEVKKAKDQLRVDMADLAVKLAEEIVSKAYTAEDQQKAVAQTIQNVERVH